MAGPKHKDGAGNPPIHTDHLQIRLECLKVAASRHSSASNQRDLLASAEELYGWVTGKAQAPVDPAAAGKEG
jgi:hypothetical protein